MCEKEISPSLKNKIIQIWEKFIGSYYHSSPFSYAYFPELFVTDGTGSPQNLVWKDFHDNFSDEAPSDQDFFRWCCNYLLKNSTEKIVPLIELTFNYMSTSDRRAVQELNNLFEEHRLPYQFREGKIMLANNGHLKRKAQ